MGKSVIKVEVILDDDIPEYMDCVMRCGTVRSIFDDGSSIEHLDLIDNKEYFLIEDLISDIARRIDVKKECIEVIECNISE